MARILLYHGVRPATDTTSPDIRQKHTPEAIFRKQMELIRSRFLPMKLSEIVDALRTGTPLPKNGICITFDDGYENNATTAAPILKELGIPATFFVTTGFLDGTTRLWVDRFETAYAALPTKTEPDDVVRSRLKRLPNIELEKYLTDLEAQTGTSQTIHPLHQAMTWEQARGLLTDGFEIGAHTVTHPILSRCSHETIVREITDSKRTIERECRTSCRHFAHPNGQPDDWNDDVLNTVKASGFDSCLTTVDGALKDGDDPFMLNRITIDTGSDLKKFALTVFGIRSTIAKLRRKIGL